MIMAFDLMLHILVHICSNLSYLIHCLASDTTAEVFIKIDH